MKKLVAYIIAFIVALFCAAAILAPAIAGAEDIHDESMVSIVSNSMAK